MSLTWNIDQQARDSLDDEVFGKRILVTNHDDRPTADVVAAYRPQADAEFGFRQLKDPHAVSFSPMNHFTDQAIRVHTYTCVLALQLVRLVRRHADQEEVPASSRLESRTAHSASPSAVCCTPQHHDSRSWPCRLPA